MSPARMYSTTRRTTASYCGRVKLDVIAGGVGGAPGRGNGAADASRAENASSRARARSRRFAGSASGSPLETIQARRSR